LSLRQDGHNEPSQVPVMPEKLMLEWKLVGGRCGFRRPRLLTEIARPRIAGGRSKVIQAPGQARDVPGAQYEQRKPGGPPSWLFPGNQAEPVNGALLVLTSQWASETAFSAISQVRLETGLKSLKGGGNSRPETREFAGTTILRPCVKRLGMSSYLLALNGWGLCAYGRLGNLRL
jgi:hypothetical protein